MKPSLSYALFLLFLFTATCIPASAQDVIKDSTGENVLNNRSYNIGPAISGKGGAIRLTDTMNKKKICPLNVVQDPQANLGGEFIFTMTYDEKYLTTSRVIGIDSGYPKGACQESTFWTIPDAEAKAPANLVTTGGGFVSTTTCFQVVPYPKPTNPKVQSYMLQHIPSLCGGDGPRPFYNISISSYQGQIRLATVGTPFEFVFHMLT